MRPVVSLTENNDKIILQRDDQIELWNVPSLIESPKLELVIKKKKGCGIYTSQISPKGDYLCYSDINGITLYKLTNFTPSRLTIPFIPNSQSLLQFSFNTLYSVSINGYLNILDLNELELSKYPLKDPETGKLLSVRIAAISSSSDWLVFATNDHTVWTYNISTKEMHWRIPYEGVPTCIKCLEDSRAIIINEVNKIFIFDLAHKCIDPWTRHQGRNLPVNYLERFNRIYDIVQLNSHKFVLYTHYTFIVLDTDRKSVV